MVWDSVREQFDLGLTGQRGIFQEERGVRRVFQGEGKNVTRLRAPKSLKNLVAGVIEDSHTPGGSEK